MGANSSTLGLDVTPYQGPATYAASAVWAADGATAVYLDSNPTQAVAGERFVAVGGSLTVISASATQVHGSVDAMLAPEGGGAGSVSVRGAWTCALG